MRDVNTLTAVMIISTSNYRKNNLIMQHTICIRSNTHNDFISRKNN